MVTVFAVCAVIGTVVIILQLALSLFGIGADHEAHFIPDAVHDAGLGEGQAHVEDHSTDFLKILSFRSLVAALAFFGLGGLAATELGFTAQLALMLALLAGAAAMVLVAWLMKLLTGLRSEGTVHIESAVGETATVYLTIPAGNQGSGKVTVSVQNRTMEYEAVTSHPEALKTGSHVSIIGVTGPNTLEVEPL
jgi:membrane protein implicated in regulation of membrane protease activity